MEIWKDIAGYEGYYQVSNLGNVKSIERRTKNSYRSRTGKCLVKQRILKFCVDPNGYNRVKLYKDEQKKTLKVHRLVANAFHQNPENKPHVNHINAIRHDNRVENLEWATNSENIRHAFKIGLAKPKPGSENPSAKLSWMQVDVIREALSAGHKGIAIARYFKMRNCTISDIRLNKAWVK